MDTCHCFAGQTADALRALGERCLVEPASRRLDADIQCALHGIRDFNPLDTDGLVQAHEDGRILARLYHDGQFGWIEAPPFTADLECAKALLPPGLATFYRDPLKVCATALQARALANEPPPAFANVLERRRR